MQRVTSAERYRGGVVGTASKPGRARVFVPAVVLAISLMLFAGTGVAVADQTISSTGPLTNIYLNEELFCQVDHVGDASHEFFGDVPGSCGTFLATGGQTFGFEHSYTVVSQSNVTGTGTKADPFTVVTVDDAGETGLRVTQTDSYAVGEEFYKTDIEVSNSTGSDIAAVLYHAADCFLQNSDASFGFFDSAAGGIYCSNNPNNVPADRVEGFVPESPGSSYIEAGYFTVLFEDVNGSPYPNTCDCETFEDNGAGLSWSITVPANGSVRRSLLSAFSPAGVIPSHITLKPTFARNFTGATHTVTATVVDSKGNPQANVAVNFNVTAGPNKGTTESSKTNASGEASFSYSSSAAGIDSIVAEFTDEEGQTRSSNVAHKEWVERSETESCNGLDDNGNGEVDEGFPDTDKDGIADCVDNDQDNDGVPNGSDNCPQVANADQADSNENGIGDACDPGEEGEIDNPPSPVEIAVDGQFGPPSGEWSTTTPASFLGGTSKVYSVVEGQDIYLMYDYQRNSAPLSPGQTIGPISFQVGSGSVFDVYITQGGSNTEFGPNPAKSEGGNGDTVTVYLNGEPFDNSAGCVKGAVDYNSTSPNFSEPHNLAELEVGLRAFGGCYSSEPAFWSATLPSVTPKGAASSAADETPQNVQVSSAFFKVDEDGTTHVTPLSLGVPPAPTTTKTTLSGEGKSGESITVKEGAAVTDTATLEGDNILTAGGEVTYKVYSDSECTKEVASAGTALVSSGVAGPSEAKTLKAGTYYWQASYSGDESNEASTSKCGSEVETVEPPPPPPTCKNVAGQGYMGEGRELAKVKNSLTTNLTARGQKFVFAWEHGRKKFALKLLEVAKCTVSKRGVKTFSGRALGTLNLVPGYVASFVFRITAEEEPLFRVTIRNKKSKEIVEAFELQELEESTEVIS